MATVNGTPGDDNLQGTAQADELFGLEGNDTLDGGAGADKMAGGVGDDAYVVDNAGDQVTEGKNAGTDTVLTSLSAYTLGTNVENLTFTGGGAFTGTGNTLANTILGGSGDDVLSGARGADIMRGGLGNDTYTVDNLGDVVDEAGGGGIDTVQTSATHTLGAGLENLRMLGGATLTGTGNELANEMIGNSGGNRLYGLGGTDTIGGGGGNDTLDGGDGDDTLSGNADNDTLLGGAGNDTLDGGGGDDDMRGGAGDDTYFVDSAGDAVSEAGGSGTDTVRSTISFVLAGGIENLVLATSQSVDGTGNTGANTLTGGAGANILSGLGGNDVIDGAAGNDTLDGGTGTDTMRGGTGNDIYIVDNLGDVVDETGGSGTGDQVRTTLSTYTLGAAIEDLTLLGSGNATGIGNSSGNVITGNDGNNVLTGLAGNDTLLGMGGNDTLAGGDNNDTLDGGTGVDTLQGGLGNDLYIVDNAADVVDETGGGGTDTLRSIAASYVLNAAGIENLEIGIATGASLTGDDTGNKMTGNAGNDQLFGLAGNDTIDGGAGNDLIDGGVGNDTMRGGLGDDTYVVDAAGDIVDETGGGGTDTVRTGLAAYTLGTGFENLELTNAAGATGTGNSADNVITGGAGNDTIDGGAGNDTMRGGLGNDTYMVDAAGDIVDETGGDGTDRIVTGFSAFTLAAGIENLTLTATTGATGTGNELANAIDGGTGNDTLVGLGGDDTLNGGAGNDTMKGGIGNDTYVVDSASDVVDETGGDGTDTVVTGLSSFTLAAALENLTLTNAAGATGTGNASANIIAGGAGNDTLNGLGGADTLRGGLGNDSYVVDNAGDVVDESGGGGVDTVSSSVTRTLEDGVENLTLTGTAALNGTGNALDNVIVGTSGNNTLSGLAGNDTISGGAGVDTIDGGDGSDVINGGAGRDLMTGGLGADIFVIADIADFVSTEAINGTAEAGTVDTLRLDGIGAYQFTDPSVQNIDRIVINANQAGLELNLDAQLLSTADYRGDGGAQGDLRIESAVPLTQGVLINVLTYDVGSVDIAGANFGGADTVYASNLADTINVGAGADAVYAYGGDDFIQIDQASHFASGEYIDAGSGDYDTLRLGSAGTYNATGKLSGIDEIQLAAAGAHTLTLDGGATDGTGAVYEGYGFTKVTSLVAQTAAQVITVASAASGHLWVDGANLGGNDTITGGGSWDMLEGGAGADTINGGAGDDLIRIRNVTDFAAGESISGGTLETNRDFLQLDDAGVYNLGTAVTNIDVIALTEDASGYVLTVTNSQTTTADANNDGTRRDLEIQAWGNDITLGVTVDASTVTTGAIVFYGSASSSYWSGATAYGFNGDDTVYGGAGVDTIYGGAGNDILRGAAGADTIYGGAGDDTVVLSAPSDLAAGEYLDGGSESEFADTLRLDSAGTYNLTGSNAYYFETLSLNANASGFVVSLGNDILYGAHYGGDYGRMKIDSLVAMSSGVTVTATAVDAYYESIYVDGANLNGADTITGGAGNDVIRGGLGNDSLNGGLGADVFEYYSQAEFGASETINGIAETGTWDSVRFMGAGTYSFGAGKTNIDVIEFGADVAGMSVSVGNTQGNTARYHYNDEDKVLGVRATVAMTKGITFDASAMTNAYVQVDGTNLGGDDTIIGSGNTTNADTLRGGGGDDTIGGGAGNDNLYGDDGDDVIDAGAGTDWIEGGMGSDTFVVSATSDFAGKYFAYGQVEAATTDAIRFDKAGTYDWATTNYVYDIDEILLNEDAAGWNLVINGYGGYGDDDKDGAQGDTGIRSLVALTHGVTIDGFNSTSALHIDGSNWAGDDMITNADGQQTEEDHIVTGLGSDVVSIVHFTLGSVIDGTAEAATEDVLRFAPVGYVQDFDLTTGTVRNFDVLELEYGGGFYGFIALGDDLVSTADADHDGIGGDLLIRGTVDVTNGATFDVSAVTGGRITVDGSNLIGDDTFITGGAFETLTGGLGGDDFIVTADSLEAGESIDGTLEASTTDMIVAVGSGIFDFADITVANFDWYAFGSDSGATMIVSEAMANEADDNRDGDKGDVLVSSMAALSTGVTIDGSALTLAQKLSVIAAGGSEFNGNDTVTGGAGNDYVVTDGGNDLITGGLGNDTIYGGEGEDTIFYAGAAEVGSDYIEAGNGFDTLRLDNAESYDFQTATLWGIDRLLLNEDAAGFDVTLEYALQTGDGNSDGTGGDLLITASSVMTNGVTIRGDESNAGLVFDGAKFGGNDDVLGAWGADRIDGGAGSDTIEGSYGADQLTGGAGNDVFEYTWSDDGGDYVKGASAGDNLLDFGAGTASTSVDRLAFDADASIGDLYIGDLDTVIDGFRKGSNATLNVAGSEIAVKSDAAVSTGSVQGQIDALGNITSGLVYVAFNNSVGVNKAQVWYDANPNSAGGAVLLANIDTITTLAGLANFDVSDFLFV